MSGDKDLNGKPKPDGERLHEVVALKGMYENWFWTMPLM